MTESSMFRLRTSARKPSPSSPGMRRSQIASWGVSVSSRSSSALRASSKVRTTKPARWMARAIDSREPVSSSMTRTCGSEEVEGIRCAILAHSAPEGSASDRLQELGFRPDRNPQLLCFLELGSGLLARDDDVGLLRDRTGDASAERFERLPGLFAGEALELAGEDEGLAGE